MKSSIDEYLDFFHFERKTIPEMVGGGGGGATEKNLSSILVLTLATTSWSSFLEAKITSPG